MTNPILENLIGLTKEDGCKLCNDNGFIYRIVREDKNNYAITMDVIFKRINFEIDNGLISKYDIG